MTDIPSVRSKLQAHGQEHLLAFYDELSETAQANLLEQIASIDFDQLDELIATYVKHKPQTGPTGGIQPPSIIPAKPVDDACAKHREKARKQGNKLLKAGKVAAFVVAGGQGTRLGFEGPKGCFRATPVTNKPLFQIFAEQILAASKRTGKAIPWYIMASPSNDVPTKAFFRQNNYFGLDSKDVFFLVQGTMPAFGFDGKVLLAKKSSIALGPNGHGGSLQALSQSGALEDMKKRGIELISYFQVDNPLIRILDPLFIGLHDLEGAQMSAKALSKRDPLERVGNFCVENGKVKVIEYSDMPEQLAMQTTEDGHLRFSAGSIAIHLFSREFVEKLTQSGRCDLPFHRADKKVPYVDSDGNTVKPDKPNAVKLEMFVFDALELADKVVLLETLRSEEFSPVKNADGEDSLATTLHDQVRRTAEWLEEVGVTVPRDADGQVAAAIEISPLFADSVEELHKKVDKNMQIASGESVYLS